MDKESSQLIHINHASIEVGALRRRAEALSLELARRVEGVWDRALPLVQATRRGKQLIERYPLAVRAAALGVLAGGAALGMVVTWRKRRGEDLPSRVQRLRGFVAHPERVETRQPGWGTGLLAVALAGASLALGTHWLRTALKPRR